jgi:integrase
LFRWCADRDLLAVSPCTKVKKPAKHNSRARVLTDKELSAVWAAASDEGHPFGTMTKLLILTCQRRGEVTQMRWDQLDLDRQTWTIPAELSKNGHAHVLPLTDHAKALIEKVPRTAEVVFPARGNSENVFSGFTRAKTRLDKSSKIAGWTLHDLRRTGATHMASLGIAPHVIERILNHISGTFGGVAGVYNRFQYLDEMRAALTLWERHLLARPTDGRTQGQLTRTPA